MKWDMTIRKIGSQFHNLPGYPTISVIYQQLSEKLRMIRSNGQSQIPGFIVCKVPGDKLNSFVMWSDSNYAICRKKMSGRYERPIMEALINAVEDKSVFWEVGARNGYFSLALAQCCCQVVAFDMDEDALNRITEAAYRNDYPNLKTVAGIVGHSFDIDTYDSPDVVLMDVEGWEYEIITTSDTLTDAHTLIIEIHVPGEGHHQRNYRKTNEPECLESYLRKKGYFVQEIHRRRKWNYHILATKKRGSNW